MHLESSKFGTGGTTGSGGALKSGGASSSDGSSAVVSALDADGELVLKGVVRAEKLDAPEAYIEAILARVLPAHVTATYGVTRWTDSNDFLAQVALRQGRLLPGGEPNIEMVAINVVNDWQRGKLPYYTPPPDMPAPAPKASSEETSAAHAALFAAAAAAAAASAGPGGDMLAGLAAKIHPLLSGDEAVSAASVKAERRAGAARGKRVRVEAASSLNGASETGPLSKAAKEAEAVAAADKPAKRARLAAPNGGVSASVRARERAKALLAASVNASYAADDARDGDDFGDLVF